MAVTVKTDLMALCQNTLCLLGVILQPIAAEQKGSLHLPLLQAVQQGPGKPPGRSVIKGQSHGSGFGFRPHRTQQKKTQYCQ